ncbi:hypothetical protein ACA910_002771 [Epithemia clementina (nom. ined.)]
MQNSSGAFGRRAPTTLVRIVLLVVVSLWGQPQHTAAGFLLVQGPDGARKSSRNQRHCYCEFGKTPLTFAERGWPGSSPPSVLRMVSSLATPADEHVSRETIQYEEDATLNKINEPYYQTNQHSPNSNDGHLGVAAMEESAEPMALPRLFPHEASSTLTYLLQRWYVLLESASRNAHRRTHAVLGMASLFVGIWHNILLCSSPSGWATPISTDHILVLGILHTAAAVAGATRLNFRNTSEAARTAQFWPAGIINAWLAYTSLSEWALGDAALVSVYTAPAQVFSLIVMGTAIYQLEAAWKAATDPNQLKIGLWFDHPMVNCLGTFIAYQAITLGIPAVQLRTLWTASRGEWCDFMAMYPDFGQVIANVQLDTAFAINTGMFLATLLKFKALNRTGIFGISAVFNTYMSFAQFLPAAYSVGNGLAMEQWIQYLVGPSSSPTVLSFPF